MDPAELHARLKALMHEWPAFEGRGKVTAETNEWLGRAHVLVEAGGDAAETIIFGTSVAGLGSALHDSNVQSIRAILFRVLARAELKAPAGQSGAFIAAASPFDVFASLSKILAQARVDVLIVDPYIDAVALTDVAVLVPAGVPVRLLGDSAHIQASLVPALARWRAQHSTRPVEARMTVPRALHDRLIIVDRANAWALSQSIKDFAKRTPASIERSTAEISAMKRAAYDDGAWSAATVVL